MTLALEQLRAGCLPEGVRTRAQRILRRSFDSVRLVPGELAPDHGVLALAAGETVHIDPSVLELPERRLLDVLGHELAHVVQQRDGRLSGVSDTSSGLHVDPDLETEAARAGRALALGREMPLPRPHHPPKPTPALQPLVWVGDVRVDGPMDLPRKERAVLALVPRARDWLEHAARSDAREFVYPSGAELLSATLSGMHGADVLLLPPLKFQVGVQRLLELRTGQVETLVEASRNPERYQREARALLIAQGLWTDYELAHGRRCLDALKVAASPIFATSSLAERIAVFELFDGAQREVELQDRSQRRAAKFAVDRAQCIAEFCDYYNFYLETLGGMHERAAVVGEQIARHAWDRLDAVQLGNVPTASELYTIIRAFTHPRTGRQLGLPRTSRAVLEVFRSERDRIVGGGSAAQAVDRYMTEANDFIRRHEPGDRTLSQDGQSVEFRVEADGRAARLEIDAVGCLTLASYGRERGSDRRDPGTEDEETRHGLYE